MTTSHVTPRAYVLAIVEQNSLLMAWQREKLAAMSAGNHEREVQAAFGISRCTAHLAILRAKLYMAARR